MTEKEDKGGKADSVNVARRAENRRGKQVGRNPPGLRGSSGLPRP